MTDSKERFEPHKAMIVPVILYSKYDHAVRRTKQASPEVLLAKELSRKQRTASAPNLAVYPRICLSHAEFHFFVHFSAILIIHELLIGYHRGMEAELLHGRQVEYRCDRNVTVRTRSQPTISHAGLHQCCINLTSQSQQF